MNTTREPNPLRPYYSPSLNGISPATTLSSGVGSGSKNVSPSTSSLGTSARNILADMDYSDYISGSESPAPADVLKGLVEQAVWKYTSVFMAQPFEVAKTVLQVHATKSSSGQAARGPPTEHRRRQYESHRGDAQVFDSSDSDLDSPSYFTSSAPIGDAPSRASRGRRQQRSLSSSDGVPRVHPPRSPPAKATSSHLLDLKSNSALLGALGTIWQAEGAWGIWKGTNSTYITSILVSTVTAFVRSFLAALLDLPDPGLSFTTSSAGPTSYTGGLDILASSSPMASLAVAVCAAGAAGIILSPLDTVKTRLILTPSAQPPRSIYTMLKTLPSWTLPLSIAPVTILHSILPTFVTASGPLLLRSKLGIDPLITPNLFSIATFCSQAVELCLKLPLETVLRRGQMAVAQSTPRGKDTPTIVEIGPYRGLFGTMRLIAYEEGERQISPVASMEPQRGSKAGPGNKMNRTISSSRKKGQGINGLYRGWRVGMWGLIGIWSAASLGGAGSKGGDF